jgi:hypothetical protein
MSKHNKSNSNAIATKEAAPLANENTEVVSTPSRIALLFKEEGDKVIVVVPEGQEPPTADEFADYIGDKLRSAERSNGHAAFALYEVAKLNTPVNCLAQSVAAKLKLAGVSDSAVSNALSVARRVIPLAIKHGFQGGPALLKDAVNAMADSKGDLLTTEASVTLQKMFKDGVNPAKCTILDAKGNPKDVSGKPITTQSVRAVREWFDKEGKPVVGKHPEHPAKVESPAPVLTTEQRSASASNATDPENPTGDAPLADEKEQVVIDTTKKPDSAGSSPATAGKPGATSGSMSPAEAIVAGFEGFTRQFEQYNADKKAWKADERAALLVVAGKLAKHFGASVIGV